MMFGFFKSEPFVDDVLGVFKKNGQYWVGSIELAPHGFVALRLAGDRKAPDVSALLLARELPSRYASQIKQMENALYDHYLPYAESAAQGELSEGEERFPQITNAT